MEANGKYAVAQGKVRKMPMTLSSQALGNIGATHGADIDPDKITEPLTIPPPRRLWRCYPRREVRGPCSVA